MELAVLLSLKQGDFAALERHIAQARVFFQPGGGAAGAHRSQLLSLLLLRLLTDARLADFHMEVEALHPDDARSALVAYVLQLEAFLSEGAYNKILSAAAASPSPTFAPFLERLAHTVREDIADCAAASYATLSVAAAQRMLMLPSADATRDFLRSSRPDWRVDGATITLKSGDKPRPRVDAHELILQSLAYATEMERIV